ncbi:MAG: hypothetical protein JXA25_04135 [Anaerolineales bacterium]|nr:hypothetical protein [Anaerolineales bacterium]
MNIEFLYYKDCPSHETALHRLLDILEQEEVGDPVQVIEVKTMEQARALRFPGSPTIRIDGKDITTLPEDAVYGLTCRAYYREDGRITPLPPADLIRGALTNAQE